MKQLPPSPVQQTASSVSVRPASSEQALEMLDLMMADVIAQARWPLDDQDADQSKASETAAKDRLSRMAQTYTRKHGHLNVPMISMGSDYDTMNAALRRIFDKIADESRRQHPVSIHE